MFNSFQSSQIYNIESEAFKRRSFGSRSALNPHRFGKFWCKNSKLCFCLFTSRLGWTSRLVFDCLLKPDKFFIFSVTLLPLGID